jgi:hypothetical protein
MVIEIEIKKATSPGKKYMAVIHKENGRTKSVQFGAAGMLDYTLHKDTERKRRYLARHRKNEDWSNYESAGFYSARLLWNKPTIAESVRDTNNKFKHLHIKQAK